MSSKLEVSVKTIDRIDEVPGRELENLVEEDILEFDRYFQSLGNDPIVRSEVAILKTYLHWKLKGEQNVEATGS